jgi:hypothetical protein
VWHTKWTQSSPLEVLLTVHTAVARGLQFFQYVLPGCDALGYTACTGTNFCVRAQALAQVGDSCSLTPVLSQVQAACKA